MIEDYFRGLNLFSNNEINNLLSLFVQKKVKKFAFFIQEGESCKEIAFIQSGIFRSYYIDEAGIEHTFCFRFPHTFLAPYSAFITGNASVESMQAITDSSILVIKKKEVEELAKENPNWLKFFKLNAENEYLELEKRFFQLQRDNAAQRYSSLLKNQPNYIRDIPLHYLASYLGVTQRHLSRIRKSFSF